MENHEGTASRNGRRLQWYRTGHGGPTVVLDAGAGAGSSTWDLVIDKVAEFTGVLAYDRVGYGRSGPGLPTVADSVADLAAVLDAARVDGPLVLVGHSWGGLLARVFADAYPDRVAALVLIEATHEDIAALRNPVVAYLTGSAMARYGRLARSGRLRGRIERGEGPLGPVLKSLPADTRAGLLDELDNAHTWEQARREVRLARAALGSMPRHSDELPVTAVVGTRAVSRTDARIRAKTRAAYVRWVEDIPNGTVVEAHGSGHFVPFEEPELVVRVVRDMVEKI